ncbi:MAG TPA: hypothetical protein VFV95_00295 [Vicinamibacterales bacterium]|nr:hypothetical protein [Vicinamibacterales bacterium]
MESRVPPLNVEPRRKLCNSANDCRFAGAAQGALAKPAWIAREAQRFHAFPNVGMQPDRDAATLDQSGQGVQEPPIGRSPAIGCGLEAGPAFLL